MPLRRLYDILISDRTGRTIGKGEIMGLFSKKEKEKCPICGKEMTFFSKTLIADGAICDDCVKMLRGQFDIESYWVGRYDGTYRQKFDDPLAGLTTEDIRAIIAEKKESQAAAAAQYGGSYGSLFKAEDVFSIAPKPLEVGIKRAKELKDKLVVRGMILTGALNKGDEVTVIHGGSETKTVLLDLIPCDGVTEFDTALRANMHKKTAEAGTNAWLILDLIGGVVPEDLIGK